MMKKQQSTEEKILKASRKVFIRKGMEGSRMQEIADEAGINKALLHYYFRSKEKLFEAVFKEAFSKTLPKIGAIMTQPGTTITEKIEGFIDHYIDILMDNPFLPPFILGEVHRNPQRVADFFAEQGLKPKLILEGLKEEFKSKNIQNLPPPEHLMINIVSMCIFPIASRPFIQMAMFDNDSERYEKFLKERKEIIKQFVRNSIERK